MGKAPARRGNSDKSSSDEDDDAEVYVVEAIMNSRYDTFADKWRYFIKWQGYHEDDNTWEPAENLNCPELLAAYEAEQNRTKDGSTKPPSQERKSAKGGRTSLATGSKPNSKVSTPASNGKNNAKTNSKGKGKGKGKAKAAETSDEDSDENEASISELDERRAAAKKKAAKERRSSTSRAEDAVASKWEKKISSKAASKLPSSGTVTAKASSEENVQEAETAQANRKRTRSPPKPSTTDQPTSASNSKRRASRLQSDSEPDEEPPLKRSQPDKRASSSQSSKSSSAASATTALTGSSNPPRSPPTTSSSSSQRATGSSLNPSPPPATTAIRAMQFKRKPPVVPPHLQPPIAATNGVSSRQIPPGSTPIANGDPSPVESAPLDQSGTGSKPATVVKPSVRFADESDPTGGNAAPGEPQTLEQTVVDPVAEAAAIAAKDEESRKQTLANLESRLTSSEYYQRTPIFKDKSMAAACAEAVRVQHGTVLRMKGQGVAIICDSRDRLVSGEGIALGLLLMKIGARMPKQLSEVSVVCVHRRETLAPIEKMYNELINMKTHHVEFLHFGDDQPVHPILVSGFLVIPSLSALQQGMAVEAFCLASHKANVRNITVLAHPASIVLARNRLPKWQKIVHTLGTSSIPIAEKQEFSLSSPFVGLDKTTYLAQGQPSSELPVVNSDSEIAEITNLLCWKREQEPSKWRRFIIVVEQVDPGAAEAAKERGIELCTWIGLTELTRECIF